MEGRLKERIARETLENVRSRGHEYIELRKDGKRFVFFCILCVSPCYSDTILSDHLNGRFHKKWLKAAKATLLKPNPWPFNDGMRFFHARREEHNQLVNSNVDIVIPRVRIGDEVYDIGARQIGAGKISARFFSSDEAPDGLCRIWCEWFGKGQILNVESALDHELAVITFAYDSTLSTKGILDDIKYLLSNNGEDPLLDIDDDELLISEFMLSKSRRKKLRQLERIKAERKCEICRQKMLPGKDVATLLNMESGELVCSSRNKSRSFHLFHVCCLINWLLLCESDTYMQHSAGTQIRGVFCPDCQGKGVNELEKPSVDLSVIFRCQVKQGEAYKSWMSSPEELQNCSTGLQFPTEPHEAAREHVKALKVLRFYCTDAVTRES